MSTLLEGFLGLWHSVRRWWTNLSTILGSPRTSRLPFWVVKYPTTGPTWVDIVETGSYFIPPSWMESTTSTTIRRMGSYFQPKQLVLPSWNQLLMGGGQSSLETSWQSSTANTTTEISCQWCGRSTPTDRGTWKSNDQLTWISHLVDRHQMLCPTSSGDWPMSAIKKYYSLADVAIRNPTGQSTVTAACHSVSWVWVCS